MATPAELTAGLEMLEQDIQTKANELKADITKLEETIAKGGSITAAELDPIKDKIAAIDTAVKAETP